MQKAYTLKSRHGHYLVHYTHNLRKEVIADAVENFGMSWYEIQQLGIRCVRIYLSEAA